MATPAISPGDIEAVVEAELDLPVTVEADGGRLVVSGEVDSEEMRQAVLDIVGRFAGDMPLDDDLDVIEELAGEQGVFELETADMGDLPGADPDLEEDEALEPGDFTDQKRYTDPAAASGAGASSIDRDDDDAEGGTVWTPATDPVGTDTEVIGGYGSSSTDSIEVERSSDGRLGDEAIADAVRRELHEDAATNPLRLDVDVCEGVVTLRGTVQTLDDGDSAEEVARRVPGVVDVVDETRAEGGYLR